MVLVFLNQAKLFTQKVLSNNKDDSALDSAVECIRLSSEIFKKEKELIEKETLVDCFKYDRQTLQELFCFKIFRYS